MLQWHPDPQYSHYKQYCNPDTVQDWAIQPALLEESSKPGAVSLHRWSPICNYSWKFVKASIFLPWWCHVTELIVRAPLLSCRWVAGQHQSHLHSSSAYKWQEQCFILSTWWQVSQSLVGQHLLIWHGFLGCCCFDQKHTICKHTKLFWSRLVWTTNSRRLKPGQSQSKKIQNNTKWQEAVVEAGCS